MTAHSPVAATEWRRHWPLVIAAMAGLSMSALAPSSIGLFMEPLSREFGWSRAHIAIGLTIYAMVAFPLSPVGGWLIDRWGSRRMAIPGTILTALAVAALSLADGSAAQWYGLWVLYAFVALGVKTTVWSVAVTRTFFASRGLALGLTLSGNALAQMLVPVLAQHAIDNFGWRTAYQWLGLGWGAAVLALLVPFFVDRATPPARSLPEPAPVAPASLPGLTPGQALRNPALIRIALATVIGTAASAALTIHLVPILGERGVDRATAAMIAGLAGGMGIVGKLATGWIYDRWASGWLGAANVWISAISCVALFSAPQSTPLILLAAMIIGYSGGAQLQISAYLTGRYCGIRSYGVIFGTMTSAIALGVGIGPFVAGAAFDSAQTYDHLLLGLIPCIAIGGALLLRLGRYPDWTARPELVAG